MRMWMVDPSLLCDKHLLGEHVETHMFAGSILKGVSMRGYVEAGLLEGKSLVERHEALREEMVRRGMKHASPLNPSASDRQLFSRAGGKVDSASSRAELLRRCARCASRAKEQRR